MLKLQAQSSRALSNALNVASRCIAKKNSMAILDCVLLSKKGDNLVFTTSTTDSQLTIAAPINVIGGTFDGAVALPVNGIVSFLSTLPDSVVTLTLDDNHAITLDYCLGADDKVKEGRASLTYQDGSEFPLMPEFCADNITHLSLPTSTLLNAIEQAKVFSAHDEVRPVINSLCLDMSDDAKECYMVATNGIIVYKETYTGDFFMSGQPRKFMIYNAYFRVLSAFVGCEQIDIETDGQTLRFTSGDIEFLCKAIEGNYPNYNAVIPKGNPFYIKFDKKEMMDAVKRVSIFGNSESGLVRLTKSSMFVNVLSRNNEYATSSNEQVFITDAHCNEDFAIGINSTNLLNTLNAIDADTIRMDLSDPTRPCLCTADDPSPRVLTICMPMRLD